VAIGSFKCEKGEWGSWANAEVFLRGWRAVNDDGRYRHHDWTIKVDADTVFYPDRFPMHMDKLQLTGDRSVFFMNFMPGYPVVGALEAVSTIVLIAFFDQHFNECDDLAIGAAEDCWFWKCMELVRPLTAAGRLASPARGAPRGRQVHGRLVRGHAPLQDGRRVQRLHRQAGLRHVRRRGWVSLRACSPFFRASSRREKARAAKHQFTTSEVLRPPALPAACLRRERVRSCGKRK
ncbi:unnamed protein product, partial [Prorocentrum cordatum]